MNGEGVRDKGGDKGEGRRGERVRYRDKGEGVREKGVRVREAEGKAKKVRVR